MKKHLGLRLFGGLFLSLLIPITAFSQAGLTTGDKIQAQQRSDAGNGFDYGNKSGSALQQLENMTGKNITIPNANNPQYTRSTTPVNRTNNISSKAAFQNSIKMQLASGIANAFFSLIFSDNSQKDQKAAEDQRQMAALLAQRAEVEKRYNDSIGQVKYEKMMQSYKLLNDPKSIQFKSLSAGGTQFKTLDDPGAPMTMEDKERQNLKKHGLRITWDNTAWAQISPNNDRIEETSGSQEENESDKFLDAEINKIESFEGGRVAALAGRFMKDIKNETMSYLKDASDAAVSGNIAKMNEIGQLDLRKLTSNAIFKTARETANSYVEQGKEFISDELKENSFPIMTSGVQAGLQNFNICAKVSDEWKVPLRQY